MAFAAKGGKMVTLKSKDNVEFEVEEAVATQSVTIKNLIEAGWDAKAIPLPNVAGEVLRKILQYCERHAPNVAGAADGVVDEEAEAKLRSWDAKYINVGQETLYNLLLASNYLEIKGLLDLCCEAVVNMIKGKQPEAIRRILNIENDFTTMEEAEIRKEHSWAFE